MVENAGDEPSRGTTIGQFPITTALEFTEWPTEQTLGMVYGVIVRSAGLGRNIIAFFKNLAGGEVRQYTRLVEDSRRHALDRMIENAKVIGADGIVSMRFDSSEMGRSMTEIVAYGTAVRLRATADRGGSEKLNGFVWLAIIVALVGFAIGSFFVRRHGESERPRPGWQRTDEVFKDPGSDRTMRVWLDEAGQRHYVPE